MAQDYLADALELERVPIHGPEGFAGMRKAGRLAAETLDFITEKGTRQKEQSIILPLSENGADVSQLIVFSKRAGAPNTHRWLTR